jgi:hypothetical protein
VPAAQNSYNAKHPAGAETKEPSNYPEAVYAIRESRTKQGMLHAFSRDSRLDVAHTVHRPRNCREMTTAVCYGPNYRTQMLEKPIYDGSRTRCQATTPTSSSF